MPKPVRKPPGAVEQFAVPSWLLKCGTGVLILAVIIGISHVLSPKDGDEAAAGAQPAVTALNDTTFESFIEAHPDGVLVDFYSASCTFCAKLAPEFESAAQQLKKVQGAPPLVSIDAETGPKMMMKYGIERYPTVNWFWKGESHLELQRAAEKKAEKIVDWTKWAMTPAVQDLDTRAEFTEALPTLRSTVHASHRLMVAFGRTDYPDLRAHLEKAAQPHRAATVFLFIKEAAADGPMLKVFAAKEEEDQEYTGAASAEDVGAWVKAVADASKAARLKEQVEEKKAKVAELEIEKSAKTDPLGKTLEVLQAAQEEAQ